MGSLVGVAQTLVRLDEQQSTTLAWGCKESPTHSTQPPQPARPSSASRAPMQRASSSLSSKHAGHLSSGGVDLHEMTSGACGAATFKNRQRSRPSSSQQSCNFVECYSFN
ncbi:MAG: hypothetical protein SGPRY_010441 [Prymnesium sp.]